MENKLYKVIISLTESENTPIVANIYEFKVLAKKNTYWEVVYDENIDNWHKKIKVKDFNVLRDTTSWGTHYTSLVWLTSYDKETIDKYLQQFKNIITKKISKEEESLSKMKNNLKLEYETKIFDNKIL